MKIGDRAVLLLNCALSEATGIRAAAERQRQTISGYVLNIVMRAIRFDDGLTRLRELGVEARISIYGIDLYGLKGISKRPPGPRTRMLLSCSKDDARLIREAAKRRETPTSRLVLHALRRSWMVSERTIQSYRDGSSAKDDGPRQGLHTNK